MSPPAVSGARASKRIAILGSTGSVGTQVLNVVRRDPELLKVCALACCSDAEKLAEQVAEFSPAFAGMSAPRGRAGESLRSQFPGTEFCFGGRALEEAVREEADVVVVAASGLCALRATLKAVECGKAVAFASKEILVAAGHIVMPRVREKGVPFLPLDSEHSAVFQCARGNADNPLRSIILTASGGAFRDKTAEEMRHVKAADALRHPTWSMGKKITVDCATLANKGLEIVEAKWLFGLPPERIRAVVHPQSIIHSMVEFEDGAVLAQLSKPSMELPISYALYYPERRPCGLGRLDFDKLSALEFRPIDEERFPSFRLAREALVRGGFAPLVYNAANEAAVDAFLRGEIPFPDIARMQEEALQHFDFPVQNDVECVYYIDGEVKAFCREQISRSK